MATTDFNLEQYIDNKALDEIERDTWMGNREEEARQLHFDLETPLPNETRGKKASTQVSGGNLRQPPGAEQQTIPSAHTVYRPVARYTRHQKRMAD